MAVPYQLALQTAGVVLHGPSILRDAFVGEREYLLVCPLLVLVCPLLVLVCSLLVLVCSLVGIGVAGSGARG